MDYEEIPFGAFDSELVHQEIYIPEGFEANIEGNKIILKKTESKDEKIKKSILELIKQSSEILDKQNQNNMIDWLENQKSVDEIVERCKDSWYNEGKIAGQAEGLTTDEKYQQGWHDALEKQSETFSDISTPSRELIFSIWDLGNEWKELTNGRSLTEHGTQLEYIQKHWKESEYYLTRNQDEDQDLREEPKFKVGDWITDGEAVFHITSYDIDYGYQLETQKGTSFYFSDEKVESKYHLWTIQDAKKGDVLVTCFEEDNTIIMYHSRCTIDTINVHCCLDNKFVCENLGVFDAEDVKPATKEQRDLLFQKMKEAGYEWDAEKKVLNKIKMQDLVTSEDNVTKISDQDKWNGEDIRILNTVINIFEKVYPSNYFTTFVTGSENPTLINSPEIVKWLKGIKQKALGKLKLTKEDIEALRIAIINLGDMAEVDAINNFNMTFGEAKEKLIEIKDHYSE